MVKEENGKKIIDILDKVLSKDFWYFTGERKHYTGHTYYNSPIESDDNCGTCDGARCDTCKLIIEKAHIEFGICTPDLYEILLNEGVPVDVAKELAFSDYCFDKYKDYILIWPSEKKLKERYPNKYEKLLKEII